MHYTHIVALPGDIEPDKLRAELERIMDRFDEDQDVELHRDTSVYAESFTDQLAKAKASNDDNWTEGLTDTEIAREWNGAEDFDADGWPMTTRNPDGHWDWWVIGGRWGGAWVLREGAEPGPLSTDDHAMGRRDRADEPGRTDNARWRDIMPESVEVPYSWVDLAGEWHTRWIGPTRAEALDEEPSDYDSWTMPQAEHSAAFMKFLRDLPLDTWLVHIDYHN